MKITHSKTARAVALFLAMAVAASFTAFTPPAQAAGGIGVTASTNTVPAAGGDVTVTFAATGFAPGDTVSITMSSDPYIPGSQYPVILTGNEVAAPTLTIPVNTTQASITYTISFTATDLSNYSPVPITSYLTVTQPSGATAVVTALTVNPKSYSFTNSVGGPQTIPFTVRANAPGSVAVNVAVTSQTGGNWLSASVTNPMTIQYANTDTPNAIVLGFSANTLGTTRSATLALSAGGFTEYLTVTQGGVPTPTLSSYDVSLESSITVSPQLTSGQRIEVWTNSTRTGQYVESLTSNYINVTAIRYYTGTYYVFIIDNAGNPSSPASFTVRSGPARPVVTPGQTNKRAGETLTIQQYSTDSRYVFYVGVNDYLSKSDIGNLNLLIPAYYSSVYGTSVTLPSSLPKTGTYYLYVYDSYSQQLSQASVNSFNVIDAGKAVRPVVTAGQRVRQSGTLRISSYDLSSAYEFVVRASNSNTYYISTTGTGSQITNVLMPANLPEGTYTLYVRLKANTSVISDPSANTFVVDNTAPRLSATVPANNAASILPGTTFAVTFDETMDTTKGAIAIRNTATGGTQPTIGANPAWSNDNKTVTYTLSGLVADASYTVTVYSADGSGYTGFRDTAGNFLNTSSTITFRTGSAATYSGTNAMIPVAAALVTQNGVITATVDNTAFAAAVNQAVTEEARGYKAYITIAAELPAGVNAAEAVLTTAALTDMLNKTRNAELRVSTGAAGSLNFNRDALSAITAAGSGSVSLGFQKHTANTLTPQQNAEIGAEPAYEFTAKVGAFNLESFGSGAVTASVPYSFNSYMKASQVAGYKVSPAGVRTLAVGRYNQAAGTFDFNLKGFSTYTVRYSPKAYADVTGWYTEAVEYTAARGLLDVFTTGNALEPTKTVTRAEFVTIFMKAYGIEPNPSASAVPFSDVYATSPYYAYLLKGKEMGLIQGGGGNMFNPDGLVTREEFFTLTYNMLTAMKRMPPASGNLTVYSFNDSSRISAFAITPIDTLARSGVVQGSNGSITPDTRVNRGEMAQLVYNLIHGLIFG